MNRGYIKIWRNITDSAVFQNEGLLKIFVWCLTRAAYREMFVSFKTGRGLSEVRIPPGSFIFGRNAAAPVLSMSPSTVWKRMLKLEKLGILNIESNSHYSIVCVNKWHIYQSDKESMNTLCDKQGTGKEQKEEVRELYNIIKDPPTPRRPDEAPVAGEREGDTKEDVPPKNMKQCPHKEIIALYHEILPELPAVKVWNDQRQKSLRARWAEVKERQSLDWWRGYFQSIRECPLLMGKKTNFQADLEWVIQPNNLPKILEGRYRERERPKEESELDAWARKKQAELDAAKRAAEEDDVPCFDGD